MSDKAAKSSAARDTVGPAQLLSFGAGQSEAMLKLQRELLNEFEEASRAWIDRIKSEVELWSGLAAKLTASHSVPEGLKAYRNCMAQRVQMAIGDGQRLFDEGQKIIAVMTKSLNGSSQPLHQ